MNNPNFSGDDIAQEDFYDEEMEEYFQIAVKQFAKWTMNDDRVLAMKLAICVANQFIEQYWAAIEIFNQAGLKMIHACALLADAEGFREELDKILENNEMAQHE